MSIFDSSIVTKADIYSYLITVTFTAVGLIIAFKVDDDNDAFEQRWRNNQSVIIEYVVSI